MIRKVSIKCFTYSYRLTDCILQILAVCEANYPEAVKQAFLINCKEFGKILCIAL